MPNTEEVLRDCIRQNSPGRNIQGMLGFMTLLVSIVAVVLVAQLSHFPVSARAVWLQDVSVQENRVAFTVVQTDSGYSLSDCRWSVSDGVLSIEFYGTMFRANALKEPDGILTLDLGENADSVKRIEIASGEERIIAWEEAES